MHRSKFGWKSWINQVPHTHECLHVGLLPAAVLAHSLSTYDSHKQCSILIYLCVWFHQLSKGSLHCPLTQDNIPVLAPGSAVAIQIHRLKEAVSMSGECITTFKAYGNKQSLCSLRKAGKADTTDFRIAGFD